MKLATTTSDFERFCGSYIDCVKNVHQAGFRFVDLSLYTVKENDSLLLLENWKNTASELKNYASDNGIEFVQSHAPNINPLASEYDFQRSLELMTRAIEICGFLEIPNLVVHPGWKKPLSKEEWSVQNKSFFEKLFPLMEKHNVNVLHENTATPNLPWYSPKNGQDMREFSDFVNHPLFHSCWDTGHGNIEGGQYEELLAIGDDLYAVHINDNMGEKDQHIIPFFGTVNMDAVMNALIDIGFKGPFTFEAGTCLRPDQYWLGCRKEFPGDTRLLNAPLELQQELEKYMYAVGKHILSSYDVFEG